MRGRRHPTENEDWRRGEARDINACPNACPHRPLLVPYMQIKLEHLLWANLGPRSPIEV